MDATARFWNDTAVRYAKKPVANPGVYEKKKQALKARLRPHHRVLDVGCGTGSLALELSPLVAEVHAVDFAAAMIRIAEDKAARAGVHNVTFHHRSVTDLPSFEAESFDMVCAFNLLHLVEDRRAALRGLAAKLRPGGVFVTSTPCLRESWVPFGWLLAPMRWVGKAPPVYLFDISHLEQLLQDAGFVDIERLPVSRDKTTAFMIAVKAE